ncbi:MAG: dihydroxyacetone kinase subunit DhaK [Christensenella sp.]|nr:dihydroxyacetone kinase subunit DhaK [Christensenella sp.]MEA5003532.1 dihydroxyacetone kinase subunit DhaK [Christensenella sp.]
MKKIMNEVVSVVDEMCEGIILADDNLELNERYRVVKRKNLDKSKVCLISGGGSGHEPAHAGFVGEGMLSAAVCGDVFASPSTIQVYNAILQTESDAGTLLIVKNYSGDCMNFDAAAEMAIEDGIEVECVYVNDDIAVQDSLYTIGRRGVAGTVFVHKIAGAAAEAGKDLQEVKRIAEKVIENAKTIGFALTSCTVPAKGTPTFEIAEEEMEFGVGIHGEPGIERCEATSSLRIAKRMCDMLCEELKLKQKDECALLINGLGGTPLMELYILNKDICRELQQRKIQMHEVIVGNYMTSLDMAGASVTVLKLDEELKKLLDSPADTLALKI